MYLPPHFEETDKAEIAGLLSDFPLASIVAHTEAGLLANHVPLFLDGEDRLVGHIALANDMHRMLTDGDEVMAIFRGEDAYVSPNWYPSKAEHHRHVPTWNYRLVHIEGAIRFSHEVKAKRAAVGRLTKLVEERVNGESAWRMAEAPADYLAGMLDGIVAFSIEIRRIAAKSKLSQNREAGDFSNVADTLERRGETGLADAMRRRAPKA